MTLRVPPLAPMSSHFVTDSEVLWERFLDHRFNSFLEDDINSHETFERVYPWKLMVGRWFCPFLGFGPFSRRYLSFGEEINSSPEDFVDLKVNGRSYPSFRMQWVRCLVLRSKVPLLFQLSTVFVRPRSELENTNVNLEATFQPWRSYSFQTDREFFSHLARMALI